jgi:two-component system, chemotaxis family, chemotaxis protein CheY
MKILVVDDEIVSRDKLNRIMRCFGTCQDVSNGEEAIQAFCTAWEKRQPFELVMLDISMEGIDGLAVLKKIREFEKEKKTPPEKRVKITMVTAESVSTTITACIQSGCDGYILKPFNREVIKAKLDKMIPGILAKL